MNKHNGGPAFPSEHLVEIGGGIRSEPNGMTLRDYFAAKAMHGLIPEMSGENWAEICANQAYKMADAMLAERDK